MFVLQNIGKQAVKGKISLSFQQSHSMICILLKFGHVISSGSRGRGGHAPPGPVKIIIKKMAAKGGHIDFMFLDPSPQPLDPLLVIHVIGPCPLANVVTGVAARAILISDCMGVIYVVFTSY